MENDGEMAQNHIKMMLGRYQLLQRIGRGGMGEVWLSDDPRLRRKVAIKTLPPHSSNDKEFAARFEREAQAAATLNHPHILPIHDYGEEHLSNGQIINYIVMPYIANGSLADYLEKSANQHIGIPAPDAIKYLAQMAEAIDYAHEQGIIHRDIKPANMLMRSRDWLMLVDFGIARILSDAGQRTQTNIGAGTPEYMAPEQAQGKAEAASDTYSLAVIAYQIFTGHLPFQADVSYATIIQHVTMPPPPPRSYNPNLSPAFENTILRGLAKKPAERFPSARAFVAELQRNLMHVSAASPLATLPLIQGESTILAPAEHKTTAEFATVYNTTAPDTKSSAISRRALIGGGAAIVVAAVGAGIWEIVAHQASGSQAGKQTPVLSGAKPTMQVTADPDSPTLTLLGHNQPVSSLVWSPQKNILLSAGGDSTVKLWDTTSNQSKVSQTITGASSMLLSWSQDGKYVAIANTGSSADLSKQYVSIYTGDLGGTAPGYKQPIQVPGNISIMGIGWMESRYIITALDPFDAATQDKIQIGLWDITQPQLQLKQALIDGGPLGGSFTLLASQHLAISPDSKYVAFPLANNLMVGKVSLNGNNVQWQQVGGILKFDVIPTTADAVTWLPNSRILIAYNNNEPSKLVGWDMQNLSKPGIAFGLPGSDTIFTALTSSPVPGTDLIAAASKDGTIYLWNIANNTDFNPIRMLHNGNVKGAVTSMAWSADGQWLAASYNDTNVTILVWKL